MGSYADYGTSYGSAMPIAQRKEVTTTRVRDDITTTLTNIDTKSDAWGKVIPMGFGRHRVAGALVWASQFYKTTESFDDVTTQKSIVTWNDHQDIIRTVKVNDQVVGGYQSSTNTIYDVVKSSGSQVTHGESTASYIDLCYSFGTEGDKRRKRYIEKIRVNDTIVYDTTQDYIADGIGFSIRYGYDDAAPALLEKYPNGKFHYKGQTLVCFDRFPLATFGDSIPSSVDVEYGCCSAAPIIIPPIDQQTLADASKFIRISLGGGSDGTSDLRLSLPASYTRGTSKDVLVIGAVLAWRPVTVNPAWVKSSSNGIYIIDRLLTGAEFDGLIDGSTDGRIIIGTGGNRADPACQVFLSGYAHPSPDFSIMSVLKKKSVTPGAHIDIGQPGADTLAVFECNATPPVGADASVISASNKFPLAKAIYTFASASGMLQSSKYLQYPNEWPFGPSDVSGALQVATSYVEFQNVYIS